MVDKVFRGKIYYVHEVEVNGNEQSGGRPAIVVSNDIGNVHSPIIEVVYLTTKEKKPLPTHVEINSAAKPSVALCEQIETVYKGRIGRYVGEISENELKWLNKALAVSIGIGLTIKSNKLVEKWGEAYAEEPDHTIADAIANVKIPKFPEKAKEEAVEVQPIPEEHADVTEMLVKYKTERDVYKELYMELLKSTKGRIA